MAGFGGAALPLISCIALLAGAILIVLGFATPSWAFDGTNYVGLWRYGNCKESGYKECYHYDQPSFSLVPSKFIVLFTLPLCVLFTSILVFYFSFGAIYGIHEAYSWICSVVCFTSFFSEHNLRFEVD